VHNQRIPLKKYIFSSSSDSAEKSKFAVLSSIYPPDSGGPATFTAAYKNFLQEKKSMLVLSHIVMLNPSFTRAPKNQFAWYHVNIIP
jgi:hypothetical protein